MIIRYDELKVFDVFELDGVKVAVTIINFEELAEDEVYIGWAAASEEDYRILEERQKERAKSNKEEKYAMFQFGSIIAKRTDTIEIISRREG